MVSKRSPMRYAHNDGHTDVCFSDDGKIIVTCGSDGDIRMWAGLEDDDPTSQCVAEHVFAVAVHDDHLYVGTDNNIVQAYTFPGNPSIERDGIISRYTGPVTHIAVSNDGKIIASGSGDMEIQIKNVDTAKSTILTGHKAPILSVALDPKGKYLASSSCDGTVCIWNLESGNETVQTWQCVPKCNSFTSAKCLSRISWQSNSGHCIAVPDDKKVIAYERDTWAELFTFIDEQVTNPFSITAFSPCGHYLAASTTNGDICVWNTKNQILVSRSSHEKRLNVTGLAWNPLGIGEIAFCDTMGQLGTVVECVKCSTSSILEGVNNAEDENFDFNLDDVNGEDELNGHNTMDKDNRLRANIFGDDDGLGDMDKHSNQDVDDDLESRTSHVGRSVASVNLQAPFQPGSTPAHLQHRYLVWNSVGIIRCQNTEVENSIDIEFNDTSVHHALHINNHAKHTMGTLTEKALVLACEAVDDKPSKLVCIMLNSWDGQKEWTTNLPDEEEALAVAAGQGWIAVATDTRNLRLFTLAGSQREIVCLPGPVVALAAHGKRLIAVYHSAAGLSDNQCLGFTVLNVGPGCLTTVCPWQPLPMSPKGMLQWVGFSDEGRPVTLDSAGMLRLLSTHGYWVPICNTKSYCKGKSDHYFVIGVSERNQNIRCVLCRGSRYPPTTPKPLVAEILIKLPLCEESSEKSQLEEKFWLSKFMENSLTEMSKIDATYQDASESNVAHIKEALLKLFALSARGGMQERALELGGFMTTKIEEFAIKYASKLNKYILVDKMKEEAHARSLIRDESYLQDSYSSHIQSRSFVMEGREGRYTEYSQNTDLSDDVDSSVNHSNGISGQTEETENLLLGAKQNKTAETHIKPILVLSGTAKKNPFKKSVSKQSLELGCGLDQLSSSFTKQSNSKIMKQYSTPELVVNPPVKSKQTTLPVNGNMSSNKKSTEKFVEWFASNKSALKDEFPELGASELTKQAMVRFKEEKAKQQMSDVSSTVEPDDSQVVDNNEESKKRKLEEENIEPSEAKKPMTSSSKLMAFAYKKS